MGVTGFEDLAGVAPLPLRIGFAVCSRGFHGPLVVARD